MKFTPAIANPLVVPAATPPARKRAAAPAVTPIARATTDHLEPRPRNPRRGLGSFHGVLHHKRPLYIKTSFNAEIASVPGYLLVILDRHKVAVSITAGASTKPRDQPTGSQRRARRGISRRTERPSCEELTAPNPPRAHGNLAC